MKIRFFWILPILISGFIIVGCSSRARYEHRLKHELASGVRHDSLFMGLYLGMPQKDFYLRCWALNKKGLVKQGSANVTVEYVLRGELKYPGTMNFYPTFTHDGKVREMPIVFVYSGWAPWNKKLSADNLELDILRWYKKVYGGGFIPVRHHEHGTAYVKIDGNRRISIFKAEDPYVWVVFTDLLAPKDSTNSAKAGNQ
ncbi:MAG: hypothetical protein ABR974_04865 [Bacteroidales bacterium]|jgi:hypothetical protein